MKIRQAVGLALATTYATLAVVCALSPDLLPLRSVWASSLVGPPYLLAWGGDSWILFSLVSLGLFGLASIVLRSELPEAKIMAGFVAVAIWLATGFFAVALSV